MTMQKVGIMQSYVSSEKRERKAQTFQAQARSVLAKSEAVRAALQRDTAPGLAGSGRWPSRR
ncbi:hypothetical protein HR12_32355 [Microbacterium sp. SUBG005]|nr:hypothetical protein HR12_32355 [Microbacterium sp. SUBG005]